LRAVQPVLGIAHGRDVGVVRHETLWHSASSALEGGASGGSQPSLRTALSGGAMTRGVVPVSILFSTTGDYAALGREAVHGALAAISEANTNPDYPFRIEAKLDDPAGRAERYGAMAEAAIRQHGCRHVIGAITSWSRKEVLPVVERHGALLWYAFPYEGYEASDNVLYLGACPNQHLLPLFDYVMPRHGRRPFIVGSNYIWGWEISRIAREITEAAGGEVVAERYVPLGSEEVDHLIAEIRQKKPDFILSNLVGQSANALIGAYAALRESDPDFSAELRPLVACNLSESDLEDLSPSARAGHITTAMYFHRMQSEENRLFQARIARRQGAETRISEPFVAGYMAASILAQAMADAGTDDPETIAKVVTARRFDTPIGPLQIDRRTHHAALRPFLGRSDEKGDFDVFHAGEAVIAADPYLVRTPRSTHWPQQTPPFGLKVVK
jgi:ABC-type branched-subunit amino acid transport system substrate-binding protein